jgi:hypothetical protein
MVGGDRGPKGEREASAQYAITASGLTRSAGASGVHCLTLGCAVPTDTPSPPLRLGGRAYPLPIGQSERRGVAGQLDIPRKGFEIGVMLDRLETRGIAVIGIVIILLIGAGFVLWDRRLPASTSPDMRMVRIGGVLAAIGVVSSLVLWWVYVPLIVLIAGASLIVVGRHRVVV